MKVKFYKVFAQILALALSACVIMPALSVNAATSTSNRGYRQIKYNPETHKFDLIYDGDTTTGSSDSGSKNGSTSTGSTTSGSGSSTSKPTGGSNSITADPVLKAEYFDDDYFYQLNTAILVPKIYKLSDYNRLQTNSPANYAYNKTIDVSHIIKKYVAPVTESGTSYMTVYDYTYVYSNDEMTKAFMKLMKEDTSLRKKIMTSGEYSDLVSVYEQYVNDKSYDVNPYVYHYIAEYIDLKYGDKLFDYDFYCKKYPSLAMLFEYDKNALKQHFYSVGMFEGRQAIETFNVDCYTTDNDDFGTYYIKYVTSADASKTYTKRQNDATQIRLYDVGFESYVADVAPDHKSKTYVQDLASPYVQGELNAQACHRVRFQLGDFTAQGHTALSNYKKIDNALKIWGLKFSGTPFDGAENAWTEWVTDVNKVPNLTDSMVGWRQCDSHYEAATSDKYVYVGQAHPYVDYNPNAGTKKNTGVGLRKNKYVVTTMTWMYNAYGASKIDAYYK